MKKLLKAAVFGLIIMVSSSIGYSQQLPLTHVFPTTVNHIVDGDTMDVTIDKGLGYYLTTRIRIKDFDAPETWRPTTEAERQHGKAATQHAIFLITTQNNNNVLVKIHGWGVYNRVEADIILPNSGEDFKVNMIRSGFEKRSTY